MLNIKIFEIFGELLLKDDMSKKLDDVERKAQGTESKITSSFKKIGGGITKGVAVATGVVAGATAVATAGIFKLAEKASDLVEAQNVVESTFKSSSKAIEDWTNTTANSAGISKTMSMQWVGFMGAMLKSSGLGEEAAGNMSKSLVQLTGDMSSFYNLSNDDAWEKIRSGISGETEPLKALGINMSVANLEAYALSKGIKTAYSEMSQAEQTTLRYNYLMEVTKDAQGDFAKTLGTSFANQVRVAQMNFETLAQSIGSIFLPSVLNATKVLNQSMAQINKLLADGFQNSDIGQISTIISGLLQKVVNGIAQFIPKAIPIVVQGLNTLIASIIQVLPTLLPPLFAGAIQLLNGLIQLIQQNAQPLANLAVNLIMQFVQFLAQALPQLVTAAISIILALVNGLTQNLPQLIPVAIQGILTLVQGLLNNLPQLITAAIQLILAIVQGLISALPMILEQAPKIIRTLINGIIQVLPQLVDAAIKIINALVVFITEHLDLIISAAIQIIIALVGGLIRAYPQIVATMPRIIGAIINAFLSVNWLDVGVNIIKGIAQGISNSFPAISDAAKRAAQSALEAAKNFLGIHSPSRVMRDQVGLMVGAGMAEGIDNSVKQINSAMDGLSKEVVVSGRNIDNNSSNNNIAQSKPIADTTKNEPTIIQLVLQNGEVIAEYLLDNLDTLMGKKNRIKARGYGL